MGAVSAIVSDSISASGRKTRGRKRTTKIVPRCFRSKKQTRPNCRLYHWNSHVLRQSSEARAAERCCVQKERSCVSLEEPPGCAAVSRPLTKRQIQSGHSQREFP